MPNPFSDTTMAAGYAAARPPVHARVLALSHEWLGGRRVRRASDLGCGAGLSTRPLLDMAHLVVGFDPAEAMVQVARTVCPGARFLAAGGEAIPLPDASVDLLAAAGSLNYARDLDAVWPEAARVLTRDGIFAVYDFSPGRRFENTDALDQWFTAFTTRHPYPASQAIPLSPEILRTRATHFAVVRAETFALALPLTHEFYLSYMLTETNVQAAVQVGTPLAEIREWCDATLAPVFAGRTQPVVFTGYLAHLRKT